MAAHGAALGHPSFVEAVVVLRAARVVVLRAGLVVVRGSGVRAARLGRGADLRVDAAPGVLQGSAGASHAARSVSGGTRRPNTREASSLFHQHDGSDRLRRYARLFCSICRLFLSLLDSGSTS